MKKLPHLIGFVSLAVFVSAPLPAPAQGSKVTLNVREMKSSPKSASKGAETTTTKLDITLQNVSANPMANLKVKWVIYGREASKALNSVVESGEETVTVPGRGTVKVEGAGASSTYRATGWIKVGKKKEHVDAEGTRLVGWSVQVFAGDALVAQAWSSDSVKSEAWKVGKVEAEK